MSPDTRQLLEPASVAGIAESLRRLEGSLANDRWLDLNNIFRLEPVKRLRAPSNWKGKGRRDLAEYVAASAPVHLWDGWNYLGLALYSLIRGLEGNVRHLAYYAELRAAMSLLASQGIGIFQNVHCVVDENGLSRVLDKQPSTHVATWRYFQVWATSPHAQELIGNELRLGSLALNDWMRQLPGVEARGAIAMQLVLEMCLDIRRMEQDRESRNEASYRPVEIHDSPVDSPRRDALFLIEALELLEPSTTLDPFPGLDKYLCRRALELGFRSGTGTSKNQAPKRYKAAISSMVDSLLESGDSNRDMGAFLLREKDGVDPRLIQEALKDGRYMDPSYRFQVLSRAILLLRMATSTAKHVLSIADFSLGDIRFWWESSARGQGLLDDNLINGLTGDSWEEISQLWKDIGDALSDLRDLTDEPDMSRSALVEDGHEALLHATNTARVGLIGLAA